MNTAIENFVSLQTLEKFKVYYSLLQEWNQRMVLVQENTLQDFESRHILDSLQIIPLVNEFIAPSATRQFSTLPLFFENPARLDSFSEERTNVSIIDIGSGAGFPGMVLAMCGYENIVLCESNNKKCIFLEEVARQTQTKVVIMNNRLDEISYKFDIILSRACADLTTLCAMMESASQNSSSVGIFHKGRNWKEEVSSSQLEWSFDLTIRQSITSSDSTILCLKNLNKIHLS